MPPDVLKYGAIGIGLAVLFYTAGLLKSELAQKQPRPEARNLILMYMAFSLGAFGIATFIELEKGKTDLDAQHRLDQIGGLVHSLDDNLGGKNLAIVQEVPEPTKSNIKAFERPICKNIQDMKALLGDASETTCVAALKP